MGSAIARHPSGSRPCSAARELGVKTVLDVVVPQGKDCWPFLPARVALDRRLFAQRRRRAGHHRACRSVPQAQAFREAGAQTVVITCGHRGALVASPSGVFRSPPFPIEFVDGTGSGDAFAAGYVHALLEGCDVGECVRVVQRIGSKLCPRDGCDNRRLHASQLSDFLRSHPQELLPAEEFPVPSLAQRNRDDELKCA